MGSQLGVWGGNDKNNVLDLVLLPSQCVAGVILLPEMCCVLLLGCNISHFKGETQTKKINKNRGRRFFSQAILSPKKTFQLGKLERDWTVISSFVSSWRPRAKMLTSVDSDRQ